VGKRTDWNPEEAQARQVMRRAIPLSEQLQGRAASAEHRAPVPLEVFYVVQTTAGVIGKRHHRVCPPLYETRDQAQIALKQLRTTGSGGGTHSIWKATTYLEPAEWLYDVVAADGSLIRPRDRDPLISKRRTLISHASPVSSD
jgi:hypothetical protein